MALWPPHLLYSVESLVVAPLVASLVLACCAALCLATRHYLAHIIRQPATGNDLLHFCAALCRAHAIPHQRVAAVSELGPALQSAWSLNSHSVVEVTTSRLDNVGHHRSIQAAVSNAVQHALQLVSPARVLAGGWHRPLQLFVDQHCCLSIQGPEHDLSWPVQFTADQVVPDFNLLHLWQGQVLVYMGSLRRAIRLLLTVLLCSADSSSLELQPALRVSSAAFQQYSLPLNLPVTTGAGLQYRQGCLLRLHTDAAAGCSQGIVGVGEVAPLPGKLWMVTRHKHARYKGAVSRPYLCHLLVICAICEMLPRGLPCASASCSISANAEPRSLAGCRSLGAALQCCSFSHLLKDLLRPVYRPAH